VIGAMEGALPFSGMPCHNVFDRHCPVQYALGVGDTFVARPNEEPTRAPASFISLQPTDFTGPIVVNPGAFTANGPFDFVGKTRAGQAYKDWLTHSRRQFTWDDPFHVVGTHHLNIDTINRFKGTRKTAEGQITCQCYHTRTHATHTVVRLMGTAIGSLLTCAMLVCVCVCMHTNTCVQ
jgi:hypothetical protein